MENKETKSEEFIRIADIEEKESQSGRKFFSVKTDKGNYSCFEYDIIKVLQQNLDKIISVEIAKNDRGFQNIRKILSIVETPKMNKVSSPEKDNFADARSMKDQSIYTSYAKDIFCALGAGDCGDDASTTMMRAIALVKQAKEAFK